MSDIDYPKIYQTKLVKVRRKHHCIECGTKIQIGEEVHKVDALYDEFRHFYTCKECQKVFNYVVENFDFGWDCLCHGELGEFLDSEGVYYDEESIEKEASQFDFYNPEEGIVKGQNCVIAPRVDWLKLRVGGAYCLSVEARSREPLFQLGDIV